MKPPRPRTVPWAEIEAASQAEARRLSMLRLQLLDQHPFWGHLLLKLKLVMAPDLEALAATDCVGTIWVNPLHTRSLDLAQLGFVLAHELGHSVFESLPRARGRNPYLWNCATDYAINRLVAGFRRPGHHGEALYRLPDGQHPNLGHLKVLLDPRFDGLVAEAIYERLVSEATAVVDVIAVHLPCGDVPGVVPHGGLDVHLPRDLGEAEREVLRERLAEAVQAWREQGRRGDVPGGVERLVDAWKSPKVPWRRVLHRYLGEHLVPDDYSLARPNRRWLEQDVLVPGIVPREQRDVIVAVDTSGSMAHDDLVAVGAELRALASIEPNVTLLVGDAVVHQVVPARELPAFLKALHLRGGGGTDHRPVFAWIEQNRRTPDLFVGLTDLHSRFPDQAPRYPVLWVTPGAHGPAPWGRVVELEA